MAQMNYQSDFNANVFASGELNEYGWAQKAERAFLPEEMSAISRAVVRTAHNVPGHPEVEGRMSVCFFLKRGGCNFIPLTRDSQLSDGQEVNLSQVKLVELSNGTRNILRVR